MGNFWDRTIRDNGRKKFIILIAVIAFVYFAMKYLSPLLTPFLLAFLLVAYLYPRLEKMQRRLRIKKSFLTGFVLVLFFFGHRRGALVAVQFFISAAHIRAVQA